MSDQASLEAIETLELILAVDLLRAGTDAFKLPTTGGSNSLLSLSQNRLSVLKSKAAATGVAAGSQAGAQSNFRQAADALEAAHRVGWRWLTGQIPDAIPQPNPAEPPHLSAARRAELLEVYLFPGGEVGEMNDARVLNMARQVPTAIGVGMENPLWHYPQALVSHIATQLGIADGNQMVATGGDLSVLIAQRDAARDAAEDIISRVRFHYCGASDERDTTPELRKIGMKPRGTPGTGTVPGEPGTATYDAATKTLTLPALPEDSISIRAYRKQLPDGEALLCGVSLSPSVSIVQASPLVVADYEVWVVGFDGEDEGPESNHVTVDNTP